MKEYLGIKTKIGNKVDVVLLFIFGLFVVASIIVLSDSIKAHKSVSDILSSVFLMALFVWGFYAAARRISLRWKAESIADLFYNYPNTEISEDIVRTELNIKQPMKKLQKMQTRKYLNNINYDPVNRKFHAYYKQQVPEEAVLHSVKCPNCGGECRVRLGIPAVCHFCDHEFTADTANG